MQGTRVIWDGESLLKEGEYGRDPRTGVWFCCTPGGHLGNLGGHTITEHEDGTITVSPSILISVTDRHGKKQELWHGYLERGAWRTC